MESLSKREIFDKIKNHLLTQMKKSSAKHSLYSMSESCLYRQKNGLMCAVGCLIKDKAYSSNLECQVVRTNDVLNALKKSDIDISDESTIDMLVAFQNLHDGEEPIYWSPGIDNIEKTFFGPATTVPQIGLDAG